MSLRLDGVDGPLTETARHVLGMPHLCPSGLSENWLWKELGHRHWGLIARALGRAEAGFGPAGEAPVYAAFRRIALRGGDLGRPRETDVLDLRSTLTQLSGTRVVSRHIAACRDRLVADVDMTSVFVRRQSEGVNRSIARVRIDGRGPGGPAVATLPARPSRRDHGEAEGAATAGARDDERDAACDDVCNLGTVVIEPCPSLDFNGAGLLYFSSFVAAVDRAEWRLLGARAGRFVTQARQAVFHGNIEVGDRLTVQLRAAAGDPIGRHRALLRAPDGRLLAEVVTHRAASPER